MTLQTSGPISINDLKSEWGSSANDLFSYYRGAGIVEDTAANSGIPTSGAISLGDFYGAETTVAVDRIPDNSWWGTLNAETGTPATASATITGINTTINLYYTIASGNTPIISYRVGGSGSYASWSSGEGGAIAISNNQLLEIELSYFGATTTGNSINVYNDPLDDVFLFGFSWNHTKT
jgi:hypothetical protein